MTNDQLNTLLIKMDAISDSNKIKTKSYNILNMCTDKLIEFRIQKIDKFTNKVMNTYNLSKVRGPFQRIKHARKLNVSELMQEITYEYERL